MHYTLCHPSVGLYGRTAIQKPASGVPTLPSDLNLDYVVMFHSDLDLTETYLLCEIVVNIHDKLSSEIITSLALGILPIKILKENLPSGKSDVEIYIATPRAFMIFSAKDTIDKKLSHFKKSIKTYKVSCEV